MSGDCLFCRIASGALPSAKVYEDENVLAFRDINPVAPTHVLVIPKRHISAPGALCAGDAGLVGEVTWRAVEIARELGLDDGGFRLVWNSGAGAGQTVFHMHLHLLGGRSFTWPPG